MTKIHTLRPELSRWGENAKQAGVRLDSVRSSNEAPPRLRWSGTRLLSEVVLRTEARRDAKQEKRASEESGAHRFLTDPGLAERAGVILRPLPEGSRLTP